MDQQASEQAPVRAAAMADRPPTVPTPTDAPDGLTEMERATNREAESQGRPAPFPPRRFEGVPSVEPPEWRDTSTATPPRTSAISSQEGERLIPGWDQMNPDERTTALFNLLIQRETAKNAPETPPLIQGEVFHGNAPPQPVMTEWEKLAPQDQLGWLKTQVDALIRIARVP